MMQASLCPVESRVLHGDCLEVMRGLSENSFDAIVTDPPYGLSFMGKEWDHGIPGAAYWTEALRVAKPGAHLLAFGGTRTYHRLTCAIEDAGWEIRDCLMWLYGSGFPKSLDVSKAIDKAAGVGREVSGTAHGHVPTTNGNFDDDAYEWKPVYERKDIPATDAARQWNGWGTALKPAYEIIICAQKPIGEQYINIENLLVIERKLWSILPANVAEKYFGLSQSEYEAALSSAPWTAEERLNIQADLLAQMDTSQFVSAMTMCLSTVMSWRSTLADLSKQTRTSTTLTEIGPTIDLKTLNYCLSVLTPQSIIQDAIATRGLWQHASPAARYLNAACHSINNTLILSAPEIAILKEQAKHPAETGLAPNWEPIILARKPLSGTVAENVLSWGCGGLNIDGSRIGTDTERGDIYNNKPSLGGSKNSYGVVHSDIWEVKPGRWPANLLLDEEAATMLDQQSGETGSTNKKPGISGFGRVSGFGNNGIYGKAKGVPTYEYGDKGGASRFFYCAKASASERGEGNTHPTVKPLKLMEYLIKLITPEGGTLLDPFAGSGTTLLAASNLGIGATGIELNPEYISIIEKRVGVKA
jgi:hypothetical protein